MSGENQILNQTYLILRQIGKGGASIVYLAYHLRLQKYVVVKQYQVYGTPESLRREADILKELHHSFLPQVYDFIWDGSYVYTVMDYVEGRDLKKLYSLQKSFRVEDLVRWFRQLTEVLIYLHGQDPPVIHSDIKPSNLILTPENNVVLIDFNISLRPQPGTVIGLSTSFASPEQVALSQQVMTGEATHQTLDGRSDIYSLAATFYYLMSGRQPSVFYGTRPLGELQTGYPAYFCEVIDKAMRADPEDRYQDAEQLKKALLRMRRREAGFRRRMALVCSATLLAALLVTLGIYQGIRKGRIEGNNRFKAAYNTCIQAINTQEADQIVTVCLNFLNEQDPYLDQEPKRKGNILIGLGQAYLELTNYGDAEDSFAQAMTCFDSQDSELLECYIGALRTAIAKGERGQAQYLLTQAKTAGVSAEALQLLQVQLDAICGREEACLVGARELEQMTKDPELLVRADLAAAEVSSDPAQKLIWYQEAADQAGSRTELLRQLGHQLLTLATDSSWEGKAGGSGKTGSSSSGEAHKGKTGSSSSQTGEGRGAALELAAETYRKLILLGAAGINDYLNRVCALRLNGQYEEALQTLQELEDSPLGVDSGILWLQKAFIYSEKGDTVRAMEALRQARVQVEESEVTAEEWAERNRLLQKYGLD